MISKIILYYAISECIQINIILKYLILQLTLESI